MLGENAHAAARTPGDLPSRAIGLTFDAADPIAHDVLARRAVDELGGLDVWVNAAGIYPFNSLLELADEQWPGGCIINMSSTAGYYASGPAWPTTSPPSTP